RLLKFVVFLMLTLTRVNGQDHIQDAGGMSAQTIRDILLGEINKLRGSVDPGPSANMNYLKWSDELEVCAMKHAVTCPDGHSDLSCANAYENLHWFSWPPSKETLESKIYSWWVELYSPGYDWFSAKAVKGDWRGVGHYTNEDEATVLEVGCGFVDCTAQGKQSTLVCQYHRIPRAKEIGNYVEKVYRLSNGTTRLYEVGEPCTNCRDGNGWCYKKLCVEECPAGTKGTDCKCALADNCHEGTLNTETCQCECDTGHVGLKCDRQCMNFRDCNYNADCSDPYIARTQCPGKCGKCSCVDHGQCAHGSYDATPEVCSCVCEDGWTGEKCDGCQEVTCQNGGVWNPDRCACDCVDNWGDKGCTADCDIGDPTVWPCDVEDEASDTYSCRNSWFRSQCSPNCYLGCMKLYLKSCPSLSEPLRCENGGTFSPTTCKCECSAGFAGDMCEKVDCSIGDPTTWPCSYHDEADATYCCSNKWFSDQCLSVCYDQCKEPPELPVPGCPDLEAALECANGGTFDQEQCKCICPEKYAGELCERPDCSIGDPIEWPCSYYDEDDATYRCSNSWFRDRCYPTCKPECMEWYLAKCSDLTWPLLCVNGGLFNKTTCVCDCKPGYDGNLCQEVDCTYGKAPDQWPCSYYDKEDSTYSCPNSWFRDQCFRNCKTECMKKRSTSREEESEEKDSREKSKKKSDDTSEKSKKKSTDSGEKSKLKSKDKGESKKKDPECDFPARKRKDCGWAGITAAQCVEAGCCFDSSVVNAKWCFAKKG
ncbi:unnamed protein product, partial [Owenia fusiformis]